MPSAPGCSRGPLGWLLLQVLLKLFSYCVKVKVNRQQLVKLETNTLNVMLGTLNLVSSVGCRRWTGSFGSNERLQYQAGSFSSLSR